MSIAEGTAAAGTAPVATPATRTALQCALCLRTGELTSEALTAQCLARIAERNPELGAFVALWPRRALRQARGLDVALSRGQARGALFGVPLGIKDLDPTRLSPARMGSRAYRHFWSPVDGPISKRLRAAGCNLIGKTATSEFGMLPVTEPVIHPPCRNAIDPAYTSGGSSGGAGTAVASGMVPIAHGTDGAGSIRIPAALAGLVGFKPSRGLLPRFHRMDAVGLGMNGALTQDVDDAAAFLDLLRGVHYAPDAPPDEALLHQARRAPQRLRIGMSLTSPEADVRPSVRAAVLATAHRLSALGHDVQELPMLDARLPEFQPLWEHLAAHVPLMSETLCEPTTRYLRARGRGLRTPDVLAMAEGLTAKVAAWFGDHDAWLLPTIGPRPPRVGQHAGLDGEARFFALTPLGAFTAPFNVSGHPAVSVPIGRCELGLPIGGQLVGRPGADGALLALARQLLVS